MGKYGDGFRETYDRVMGKGLTNNPHVALTTMTERVYLRLLSEWAMSRFKWSVPDEIDERFIERTLFYQGMGIFYLDKRFDEYMFVRGTQTGGVNVYDNPVAFQTTSIAAYTGVSLVAPGPHESYSPGDSVHDFGVPVWANYMRCPDLDVITMYAHRLAAIDVSLQVNVRHMRIAKVVSVPESQKMTMVNLFRQIDQGNPVIFGHSDLNPEAIGAIDAGANPQVLMALRLEKTQVWNECMTLLGIENNPTAKGERLITSEVAANNGQTNVARESALKVREEACEEINRVFPGADVSVEWRPTGDNSGMMADSADEEDGDGDIYYDASGVE